MAPAITSITCTEFSYPLEDVASHGRGGGAAYTPGESIDRRVFAIQIDTDVGVAGEYIASHSPPDHALAQIRMMADYLVGQNPLERERHWSELQRALRKYDRMGLGPVDIALWDFAGKYYDAPIHELLGTYRTRLPAYASTYMGDQNGGLDSPAAYADFAEECLEMGYPAFKVHGWGGTDERRDIDREVATVLELGERVGDEMDLMLDPACEYETFADALEVGKACDEADFLWYEDPYREGGLSQHGHRTLRERIDTPLLQGEHLRGLPLQTDFVASESTDFVRADPEYDGGITGAMKIARVAEGFGLDVEYHATCPARRHCMAATRNTNYYEVALVHPNCPATRHVPAYDGGYSERLDCIDSDGTVPVPDDPGLGVDIDWSYVADNAIEKTVYE
ncbi:enolase C-terminal domain-like protein [Salinirarus marinus]|uniref:enolase C-terminal domain-like protein n=1 Tax=Salinirarus marinus TaxID=3068310 RepID=UPI003C6C2CD3